MGFNLDSFVVDSLSKEYYEHVNKDLIRVIDEYPFTKKFTPPMSKNTYICLKTYAVKKRKIEDLCLSEKDCIEELSNEIYIIIPDKYWKKGCYVYGMEWLKDDLMMKIPQNQLHVFQSSKINTYNKICVGVPKSFSNLDNVILESIKTAENIINAYKLYINGISEKIELIEYSHNIKGEIEYEENKDRFK